MFDLAEGPLDDIAPPVAGLVKPDRAPTTTPAAAPVGLLIGRLGDGVPDPAAPQRSLSRFLCKSIYGWSGEVVVDAVGVGQGEGAEGLFPALHDRAFDQSGRGSALAGG
jgi:hypothetical protein